MNEIEDFVNFRVKVDLSKFYNDERKLSYIYIDKVHITHILHLQTKIQNIFGITRPLHLVVNDVFLPVNEDIRIIKEDDVVIVLCSYHKLNTACDEAIKTQENYKPIDELTSPSLNHKSIFTGVAQSDDTNLDVNINVPCVDNFHVVENKIKGRKRKRIRRRKHKTNEVVSFSSNIQHDVFGFTNYVDMESDKPIPKHVKFCWDENENTEQTESTVSSEPIIRSTEITHLKALLNLQKNEIPLSFSGKKRTRKSSGTSLISTTSLDNNDSPVKMNGSVLCTSNSLTDSRVDYSKIDFAEYPIYEETFEMNDIVAFQTLILDEYYNPVVSDYIVAKIISKDILANSYLCQIFVGFEQLKTPDGKFQLPENEKDSSEKIFSDQKLFTLRHSHLNKPRLIYRPQP